jgi:hypothetical protein
MPGEVCLPHYLQRYIAASLEQERHFYFCWPDLGLSGLSDVRAAHESSYETYAA